MEFDPAGQRTIVKKRLELAAKAFGSEASIPNVISPKDIETAFQAAKKARADAVLHSNERHPHWSSIGDC